MFEDISKIRRVVMELPAYEYFPYTYYITKTGEVVYSPIENATKINVWLLEIGDIGVAIYSVDDNVYIRGYRLVNGNPVEEDDVVPDVIDRILRILSGESTMHGILNFNKHVVSGISALLGLNHEDVQHIIIEAALREGLEDRLVAIFGDDVIVLSKKRFMYRYSGRDAVNIARKYAFIVESPISEISEFISDQLGKNVTFFIFESGSILCSESMCREAPLPPNISQLVSNKLSTFVSVDLTLHDPSNYRNVRLYLPSTIAIGKRILYYLDSENKYVSHIYTNISHKFPYLLIFSRKGFLGYGVLIRNKVKIFEGEEEEEKSKEKEDYLEEIVLVS